MVSAEATQQGTELLNPVNWVSTVPVAQLVRASDRHSEDPGSNLGWISMSFFHHEITLQ